MRGMAENAAPGRWDREADGRFRQAPLNTGAVVPSRRPGPSDRPGTPLLTTHYRYKRPPRKRKAVAIDPIPASCSSCAWQADKKLLADLMVLQKHRSGVLNPGADMRIYDNR